MAAEKKIAGSEPVFALFRSLAQEAGRRKLSHVVAEGSTLVQRAVADQLDVSSVVYTSSLLKNPEGTALLESVRRRGLPSYQVSSGLMGTLTATRPLPEVIAAVALEPRDVASLQTDSALFLLVIDGVQNPDNLGMLLRTADAAGVDAVVYGGVTDPTHKNCVRAARGAVGRIKLYFAPDLPAWLDGLRRAGFTVAGATAHAPQSVFDVSLLPPVAIVVGNEQVGLSQPVRASCGALVTIPMAPGQDSLNVAVASGILLYEVTRQRLRSASSQAELPA